MKREDFDYTRVIDFLIKNKKNLLTVLIILVSASLGVWWFLSGRYSAHISFFVAPLDAKIVINDVEYENQKVYKFIPGTYKVAVSKEGFITQSANIEFKKRKTEVIEIALEPLGGDYSYYLKNREDDLAYTRINDKLANKELKRVADKYPILQYIPYKDQSYGLPFTISPKFVGQNEMTGLLIILNTCSGEDSVSFKGYKRKSLRWIESKGFDPADFEIEFKQFCDIYDADEEYQPYVEGG